jgi:small-conductance mechanosensitive channel
VAVPNARVVLRGIDNLAAMPLRPTTLRGRGAYETGLEHAQGVVLVDAVGGVEEVDSSRDPKALVEKLGPTGVTFAVRFWHGPKTKDMWNARSAGAIAIKSALEKAGIQAPTPHQAVWVQQGSEQLKGQT